MNIKKISAVLLSAVIMSSGIFAGCGKKNDKPEITNLPSTLVPVDRNLSGASYQGVDSTEEQTVEVFASDNGACVIEKKASYYDVTLDYENFDPYTVGKAYGETILKAYPDYASIMEPYLFENIRMAFDNLDGDYTPIEKRIDAMRKGLEKEYLEELNGFADGVSNGKSGFKKDGIITCDEALLLQFVPDVLRPTSCSAISVNGNKTATGHRFTARTLEWNLGSENQICTAHCVVHFKNGDKSFTSVSLLGMLSILTAVNNDGVFCGEFDVGSFSGIDYNCAGKKSYTYSLRYAIENFKTARTAGEYMVENAEKFTFNVNVMFADDKEIFCGELCLNEQEGTPTLRDSSTPVHKGLEWDDPDFFCIVNSFAVEGNGDQLTCVDDNIVRWNKYNENFCSEKNIDLPRFKELLTCEKTDNYNVINYRSAGVVHTVIVDHSNHTIHTAFTGTEGVTDNPEFVNVGKFD